MAYTAFNVAKPVVSDTRQVAVDYMRTNMVAMRDALVGTGIVQGFSYNTTGGTAAQPATLWYKRGTEAVKIVLTWGNTGGSDGNVTKMAFYYAANESHASFPTSTNGTYDAMADASGNYVAHVTYDSNGNVYTGTTTPPITWDASP